MTHHSLLRIFPRFAAFAVALGALLVTTARAAAAAVEPARYRMIVVTIVSRAADKDRSEPMSDTGYTITQRVLATDSVPPGGYDDHTAALSAPLGVRRERRVFIRANNREAHVAVVAGEAVGGGGKITRYGVGVAASPEAAQQAARADLAARFPTWAQSGTAPRPVGARKFAADEPLTNHETLKRRIGVTVAWRYVPAVSASAQTDLGYAWSMNRDQRFAATEANSVLHFLAELESTDLHAQNREELTRKIGPYQGVRTIDFEVPLARNLTLLIVSASIPTPQGPVLKIYGAGAGETIAEATAQARKYLAGHSWGWSEQKHGMKTEEVRVMVMPRDITAVGTRN